MDQLDRLCRIKEELHLTNDQIAEAAKLPLPTVQKVMSRSTKNPRLQTLMALAKGLEELQLAAGEKAEGFAGGYLLAEDVRPWELKSEGNLAKKPWIPNIREEWDPAVYPVHRYTVEDYNSLPEDLRVELIDGEFYLLSAPRTIHQRLLMEISYQLSSYVRSNNGSCEVLFAPLDVRLVEDEHTVVQPDIVVVCDPSKITEKGVNGAPDLVLEVLSPSSKRKDMLLKTAKYMKAGVREYWIVDPDQKRVLIYHQDGGFIPVIYDPGQLIPVGIWDGGCLIDLSKLFYQGEPYELPY